MTGRGFSGHQRVAAYRSLARSMRHNEPPLTILERMVRHASDDGRHPKRPAARAFQIWHQRVRSGQSLGRAMRGWVPIEHSMLVEAGERSDTVSEALTFCAFMEESFSQIRASMVRALSYPVFLLAMFCALLWMLGVMVLPSYMHMRPVDEWEGPAQYLPGFFDFVIGGGLSWSVAVLAGLFVAFWFSRSRWTGPLRDACEWMPPYAVYRMFQGTSFLIAFSALLRSGVSMDNALLLMRTHSNPWLRRKNDAIRRNLRIGHSLAESIWRADRHFPDLEVNRELRSILEVADFGNELDQLVTDWVNRTVEKFEGMGKLFQQMGVLVIGGTLGFVVIAMMDLVRQNQFSTGLF